MSEDFFESILPPVKGDVQRESSPVVIIGSGGGGATDLEKLWEEIYASDDQIVMEAGGGGSTVMGGSMGPQGSVGGSMMTQVSIGAHTSAGTGSMMTQGIMSTSMMTQGQGSMSAGPGKIIPLHNGLMQATMAGNNGGKVFIVPNKRKAQFVQDEPAKAMRFMAGVESRKIFQAALMNRNSMTMSQQAQQGMPGQQGLQGQQQMMAQMEVHEDDQEEEAETHTEIYAQYQPAKLKKGRKHPYPVVESSSLASVEVPNIRYNLSLPQEITAQGRLSNVQLESVIYACQRHEEMLPNGERAGYLIGDGAGVGKGRTLAAIIYENYLLKRKRSVWISVSNDLKHDAERDLRDLGADISIHALNKLRYAKINSSENGNLRKGVLFVTYASLIGECQSMPKSKYKTRFRQIVQWFGSDYNGVIVFDECHKAKNLMPQGSQKKTKTAEVVLKLQETLPQARVIYSSATGASEPRNMAYMTRLGLWGTGTPFKRFEDFVEKLEDKVGAMELVAVDMKQRGMYIARQLSFANVTFRIQEVELSGVKIGGEHRFYDVYNESVDLWTRIFVKMGLILGGKAVSKKFAKTIWGQYWAAHQRFFKYLCMAGKVQECVRITIEAISQQKCVVIGLQSTGEAKTNEMLEESGGDLNDFVSCAKGILQSFIVKFFPTEENIATMGRDKGGKGGGTKAGRKKALGAAGKKSISLQEALGRDYLEKVTEEAETGGSSDDSSAGGSSSDDSDTTLSERRRGRGARPKEEAVDSEIEDEDVEELMSEFSRRCEQGGVGYDGKEVSARLVQRELLEATERLAKKLPINTLDDLIRELGGPDFVAEMSGRKGRMVMHEDTGEIAYTPRRETDVTLEQINLVEKERFNTCQKLVAIISDAASTGISLHADKRYDNSLQRVHITLELPWSADRAIQQFGRTHRSNQLYPPEYVFLISDLAGERRFASTVAKRLESLGALTHGDRRATETRDLSQFNIDNKFGRRALDHIFDCAFRGRGGLVAVPRGLDLKHTLEQVGLQPKDSKNVSKFLNRILGMRLETQNTLFQHYSDTMEQLIRQAKRNQEFDRGIIDLAKEDDNIFVEETQDFKMTFLGDDIKVQLHRVKNITGMSWRSAAELPRGGGGGGNSLDGFYVTKSEHQRRVVLAVQKKDRSGGTWFTVHSPNVGEQTALVELKALNSGYRKVALEEAERVWTEIYSVTEDSCMHMYWYKQCRNARGSCDIGCRSKIRYVLSGSIFYIWDIISSIHKSPQLARVRLNDGSKIIGCIIHPGHREKITEILSNRRSQAGGGAEVQACVQAGAGRPSMQAGVRAGAPRVAQQQRVVQASPGAQHRTPGAQYRMLQGSPQHRVLQGAPQQQHRMVQAPPRTVVFNTNANQTLRVVALQAPQQQQQPQQKVLLSGLRLQPQPQRPAPAIRLMYQQPQHLFSVPAQSPQHHLPQVVSRVVTNATSKQPAAAPAADQPSFIDLTD